MTLRVADLAASTRFYETVLATLGREPTHRADSLVEWDDFSIAQADAEHPPTARLHVGFAAPSRARVDEFWKAGTDAGHPDDGRPGPRPVYSESYYGGFLLDPDGNSAEAAHHDAVRTNGTVDHLWIRVADLEASKRFYTRVAPHAGFQRVADFPDRTRFSGGSGSFTVVDGTPSENVHLAFAVAVNGAVDTFFELLTEAGYRGNGAPGERPEYHDGYYAAYVLDPDGNNVELVNHNRHPPG